MIIAKVSGVILEKRDNSYLSKKGEQVNEQILSIYQKGNSQLLDVSVPSDYDLSDSEMFDDFVAIRPWFKDGRGGVMISLKKD